MASSSQMEIEREESNEDDQNKNTGLNENEVKDNLVEGLVCIFQPTINLLDERIAVTKESQILLKEKIDNLADELQKISNLHKCPFDLEVYVKKLAGARKRVTVVSNVLQSTQERLSKVQVQVAREAQKRRALLEPSPVMSPVAVETVSPVQ